MAIRLLMTVVMFMAIPSHGADAGYIAQCTKSFMKSSKNSPLWYANTFCECIDENKYSTESVAIKICDEYSKNQLKERVNDCVVFLGKENKNKSNIETCVDTEPPPYLEEKRAVIQKMAAKELDGMLPMQIDEHIQLLKFETSKSFLIYHMKITTKTKNELEPNIIAELQKAEAETKCKKAKALLNTGLSMRYEYIDKKNNPLGSFIITKNYCLNNN